MLAAFAITCSPNPCAPQVYTVAPDGSGDYPTIQAAIDVSRDGDTIELTDGYFRGDGNRDLDYQGKAITIRSQSDNPSACVIDCEATEADPQFGPAFGYLAFTYWRRRNYEDAIPNLQRAIMLVSTAARRRARAFTITVENRQGKAVRPSSDVVMSGDFVPVSLEEIDRLEAALEPVATDGGWQGARGVVTFDTQTGVYTVTLKEMPATRYDQAYVGWFEGVRTLSGAPVHTGQLSLDGGSLEARFEASWVSGPRIDYFYTLGLAYFYLDECEKAYPLFDAALQIDPEDENAVQGIRLCQQAEANS